MKITILAVGKRHNANLSAAINDYNARLQRYATVDWQFVPSPHADLSPDEQRARESHALSTRLKADDIVLLLDERGQQWSTREFAAKLQDYERRANRLVIIIGGAHGVTDELRNRATDVLALSKLIFPHQLVRLILAEQLYRAFTVTRNEPYHHD